MKITNSLEHLRRTRLARRKQRYDLARNFGFNSDMATMMAGWSESRIRKFALETGKKEEVQNVKN